MLSATFLALCLTFAEQTISLPNHGLGPSAYTVPGAFPTSLYQSYYNDPTATSAEPQPVISDPVTVSIQSILYSVYIDFLQDETYPYWLTDPETIPQVRCPTYLFILCINLSTE